MKSDSLNLIKTEKFDEQKALILDASHCRYDIIFGNDFMAKAGIVFNYEAREMSWLGILVPMRTRDTNNDNYDAMVGTYLTQEEDEYMGDDWLDSYATSQILDAKYDAISISEVLDQQSHLNDKQRRHKNFSHRYRP